MDTEMRVKKRDGTLKTIEFDKILRRLKTLGNYDAKAPLAINYTALAMKVIDQIYDCISTAKIDELSAEQCMAMSSHHPDYSTLAGRIVVSNHQKNTKNSFSEVMTDLYNFKDKHGKQSPLVSDELYQLVQEHGAELDAMCDYSRDYLIDYFGFKTLERSYLMKINGKTVERPQHMWLRVSVGIHGGGNLRFPPAPPFPSREHTEEQYTVSPLPLPGTYGAGGSQGGQQSPCSEGFPCCKETYDYMSRKYMTHATPTLFNAGTPHPQLSSCFLQAMESDSIDGIYNTLKDCALISKWAGGIGLHIHNVRASGSHIRGTNGNSNGIVPMLKVFNNTAKYVDQCVHPETKIYTTNGTMEIQSCVANQTSIYNLTGGTEIIQNVLEHEYDGEFLHITSETGDVLRITPQHPVYAVRSGTNEPDWIDAGELRVNDYIVHSVPTWSQDIPTLSAMDCYMCGVGATYGFPLLDRCLNATRSYAPSAQAVICAGGARPPSLPDDSGVAEEVAKYLDEKLIQWRAGDCRPPATHSPLEEVADDVSKYLLGSVHSTFRRSDFFDDAGRKRIQSRWMNLPIEKSKHILRGLYRKCEQTGDVLTFHTEYGEDVRMLCLRLGTLVRVQKDKVMIPKTREICDLLGEEYQGFVAPAPYIKAVITNIQTTEYHGLLYDFQMKDEHNYMLTSGLVHNGGGKRNGSFAIYLEPWHADIELFLQMRKNHGDEELKARDLFYAIWMPDLFMERVKTSGKWTLMCPDECPGLADVYGDEFVALYEKYEAEGKGRKTVEARDIWFQILDAQMETGTPYLLFKDACNKKSNQKNLGTIKSSNLCVAPETLVLTNKGHVEIQTICGQTVSVWNGEEFSDVEIVKTGTDQELITVHTDNGSLTCTPYHKFYIQDDADAVEMVEAKDLKSGDKLIQFKYPVIDGIEPTDVVNNFVVKITDEGRKDDTYCFTEHKRHMGVFNGILTGQCSEIVQYSDANETAVCNLASIALPTFVSADGIMDYDELHKVAKILTSNLNKVIDINYYPIEKTRTSNMRHRPVGIGVIGLSCVFMKMNVAFDSDIARDTNKKIFETIYHAALERSCELAERDGAYATFAGSPASRGELQFDLWGVNPGTDRYNWPELKQRIIKYGIRNSLLLAPMPTASTSQILGFNECFEPITSNIYNRRTIAGEFMMTNKYLMNDLLGLGLWNEKIKNNIIANNGSVQHIEAIPKEVRDKYKTVWEMSMKCLIDMSADRGAFICQSQSLNLWLEEPNYNTLTSMHFYSWSKGLKTGIYYLRRRARHQAQQFTIEPTQTECLMCGS